MKHQGFGHLKNTMLSMLFTINTSKHVGFLGPMVYIPTFSTQINRSYSQPNSTLHP